MGVQDIIVGVIFIACVVWIGRHIYKQIQSYKNKGSFCSGCSLGCSCSKSALHKAKNRQTMNGPSGHSCCTRPNGDFKYDPKK